MVGSTATTQHSNNTAAQGESQQKASNQHAAARGGNKKLYRLVAIEGIVHLGVVKHHKVADLVVLWLLLTHQGAAFCAIDGGHNQWQVYPQNMVC